MIELYTPHKTQLEVLKTNHRFKVICVGRQWGKTELALSEMVLAALDSNSNNGLFWYIAPTFAQAKDIAWTRLKRKLGLLPDSLYKKNEQDLSVEFFNGTVIKLMGAEDPDRLRGVTLDGLVCDEFAFWRNAESFDKVIVPALAVKRGWCLFISTPDGFNEFYRLFLREKEDDSYKSFRFTSYDNPYLPVDTIEQAKRNSSKEVFAQEWMAEFTKFSGACWTQFSEEHHIVHKYVPDNQYPIYGSIDFGFATSHPTAFMLHEVRPDRIITFDGFMQTGLSVDALKGLMQQYMKGLTVYTVYADSARPDLIETLKPIVNMKKANKDVELGIAKVAEYMQVDPLTNKPRWGIAGHLVDMIQQIKDYRWQEIRGTEGSYKKVPVKKNDDACFAQGTLIMTTRGEVPIEDIMPGDNVITPFGASLVTMSGQTGVENTIEFAGSRVTKNHKICTQRGFIPISKLKPNDIIITYHAKKFGAYALDRTKVSKEHIRHFWWTLQQRSLHAKQSFFSKIFTNPFLKISLSAPACSIKNSRAEVDTRVVNLNKKEPVYNLSVLDGMYVANGVLYSNCDALRYMLYTFDGADYSSEDAEADMVFNEIINTKHW